MEEQNKPTKTRGGKSMWQAFALGIVVVLILAVLVVLGYGINSVKKVSDSSFALNVAKTFNLSAAKINGLNISYVDYMDDLQTLKKFYSEQTDVAQPSEEDISDQVISRLMANKLIAKIAKVYDVEVLDTDVAETKTQLLAQFENEQAAEDELMSRYGWTLEKYINKVVKPLLLEQKLQKTFEETSVDSSDAEAQEQVQASHILFQFDPNTNHEDTRTAAGEVLKQIQDGADFAEMATQYGSDGTKDVGGDLGWFGRGMMVPEFEEAVFALEPGQLSDQLVETEFGYHIVKLTDKRYVRDFVSFMDEQIKTAKVKILINIHNPFETLASADDTQEVGENMDDAEDTEIVGDTETEEVDNQAIDSETGESDDGEPAVEVVE